MRRLLRRSACLLLVLASAGDIGVAAPLRSRRRPGRAAAARRRFGDARAGAERGGHGIGRRRGLTDSWGEARIPYPEDGELRVRVRQLGFRYVDRTFRRDTASRADEDTAVVALARMGFALPQVVVRAERRCKDGSDAERVPLSQASMELLRFGAEQFDNFRRAYPFDITMERRTTLTTAGRTMRRKF